MIAGRARRRAAGRGRGREATLAEAAGARFAVRDPPRERPRRAAGRRAPVAAARRTDDATTRACEVERVWGPLMNREPGRDTHGDPRGVRRPRDRRAVPASGSIRSATSPTPRSRAGRSHNVPTWSCRGSSSGSLERYADAFLPAAPFLEKDGHVTTWEGRGQRLGRSAGAHGISARRTGRSSRAWRWPAAATSGSRPSRSSTTEMGGAAGAARREPRLDLTIARCGPRAGARGRLPLVHLSAAGRRGSAVRAGRRAEGGPRGGAVRGGAPGGCAAARARGRAPARRHAPTAGEVSCRRVTPSRRARRGVRAVQPARPRGEHAAVGRMVRARNDLGARGRARASRRRSPGPSPCGGEV